MNNSALRGMRRSQNMKATRIYSVLTATGNSQTKVTSRTQFNYWSSSPEFHKFYFINLKCRQQYENNSV